MISVPWSKARASQLGIADSANAGSVSQMEVEMRTIYCPGELLEAARPDRQPAQWRRQGFACRAWRGEERVVRVNRGLQIPS
ncbi:MAG: hypothetical protein ACXWC4_24520 [Telluria sp.]